MDFKEKEKHESSIAVKKIEQTFEHRIYTKTKRTLRELKMQIISQHDNVKL